MKKHIVTMLAACTFMTVCSTSVNAAGCGSYYIYKTSTPKCRSEKCGIWDSKALVQYQYSKRKCVKKDNTTYWQYKTDRVHIDCGC